MDLIIKVDLSQEVKQLISKEIAPITQKYPMFIYDNTQNYSIELLRLSRVDADLQPLFVSRLQELLFEFEPFSVWAHEYVVKIKHQIDIHLEFQESVPFRHLAKTIYEYFLQKPYVAKSPFVHVAKFKIPSKQQYSHLKNNLAQVDTNVEVLVNKISIYAVSANTSKSLGNLLGEVSFSKLEN